MSRAVSELEVSLRDVTPRVWRRLRVPGDTGLGELHRALQVAMGWEDRHLHLFEVGGERYGVPDPGGDDDGVRDETEVRLLDVAPGVGDRLRYTYDLGDWWEHDLVVRDVRRLGRGESAYAVLDGGGACPPEDVGGAGGYAEFRAALADPDDSRHDEVLEWVGGLWDDEFGVAEADADLRAAMRRNRPRRRHSRRERHVDPEPDVEGLLAEVGGWWQRYPTAPVAPRERMDLLHIPGPDPDSIAGIAASADAPPLQHWRPVEPRQVDLALLRPALRAKTVAAVRRAGVLDPDRGGDQLGEHEVAALAGGIDPATWTADEVAEVLLDVLPAVAPLDVPSGAALVPTVRVLVRFLAATDRLGADGDGRHLLEETLDDVEVALAGAMEPPEHYDLTLDDEVRVREWREAMAERCLADGRGLTPAEPPRLRAAVPPPEDELREAAASAPLVGLLLRLVEWLGPGRRVTAKGNLGVADAKELVTVLGTGDTVDRSYGRDVRTRTVDDLPGVSLLVRLAEAADVVRREGPRLVAGPAADLLVEDPLGAWYVVAVAAFRVPLRTGVRLEYDDMARDGLPFALAVAEGRDGRAAVAELADLLWWRTRQHWSVAHGEELLHDGRRDGVDAWAWRRLRLLERAGAVELGQWHGIPYVELTPLGSLGLRAVLALEGITAPVAGALAGESAEGLAARALELDDPELVEEELRRWVAARGDTAGAGELVTALLGSALSENGRHVLLAALQHVGADAAAEVERLEAVPALRPYGRLWQISRGLAAPAALSVEDGAAAMLDVLAVSLAAGGPGAVVAELAALGSPEQVARVVAELWRVDGPHVVPVLEAVAAAGEKPVAKAARKAAFKARSR